MDSYPDEWTYLLKKFKRLYPLFEEKYKNGSKTINAEIARCQAKQQLSQNHPMSARNYLRPFKFTNLSFTLLYLQTYLPENIRNVLLIIKNNLLFTMCYKSLSMKDAIKIGDRRGLEKEPKESKQ